MNWQYYIVHTSLGRDIHIRGISTADVTYVFHNPCKRNQQTTLAKPNETIVSVEAA